jgi:hypothetical protein
MRIFKNVYEYTIAVIVLLIMLIDDIRLHIRDAWDDYKIDREEYRKLKKNKS